jgi:hypothetical protein
VPALAAGFVLALPAAALAAPQAALKATQADGTVTFDASGSADPDAQIVSYAWDLDGNGQYEATGAEPKTSAKFPPGATVIAGVRVTDSAGATDDETVTITLAQAAPEPAEPQVAAAQPEPQAGAEPAANVRAAASGSITIKDFQFGP